MSDTAVDVIDEIEAAHYRKRFPIFEHTVYLNTCSLGPMSDSSIAALRQYSEDWAAYGAPAWWKVWLGKLDAAKERFARLIGAAPHEVTVSHSISSALASVGSTIDYGKRSTVICAELDFPTIAHQWLAKGRQGVQVGFARSDDRIHVPFEAYQALAGPDLAAVATSHVFYATGAIQPIRRLADLAHERGARIIVDGYHAVGAIPVNVKELDVDFYVGGTLKWLLGGPGLTFIYVREELISELQPTITGWFANANQFAFDTLHLDLATSADRLELGTPSIPTAYTGVAGMDLVIEAGPERIWPRLQMLTECVVDRARRSGYGIRSPLDPTARGGIVMLELTNPEQTVEQLAERNFTVDYRPGLLRVSPAFFNTAEDVDRLMDAIDDIQDAFRRSA